MKRIIFGIALLLSAALWSGCSEDTTSGSVVFPEDATLRVLKTGKDMNGGIPRFTVRSDAFWQLFIDEKDDWVSASQMAAHGDATLIFTIAPNYGAEERTAELTLRRSDGAISKLKIVQEAADARILFALESFGTATGEIVVGEYEGWQTSGAGVMDMMYTGDDCSVASQAPSGGYEDASGGAHLNFNASDAVFAMGPVVIGETLDFRFGFGAYVPEGMSAGEDLLLYASKNGANWAPVAYERKAVSGWAAAEARFYVSDDIEKLWFKFETPSGGDFCIDDIRLSEGEEGEAELLELGGELATPADIEHTSTETTLSFSWNTVRNAAGYEYACYLKEELVETGKTALNSVTVSGLQVGVAYTFRVRALPAAESIYLESPYSEPVTAQTKGFLPTPAVWLFRGTHGMLVFEWTRNELAFGRRYNLELLDEGGNVLRSYERVNYASNATYNRSYIYNRQTFGGLTADREYTLRVQYVSEDANYNDSEWGACTTRTAVSPLLPDNCLLYRDFEETWFGGSSIDVAWGIHPKDNQLNLDYSNEEAFNLYVVYPIRCMEDSFNAAKLPDQYRRKYWSGWDWSDISQPAAEKANTGLFMICGAVKFGSGSAYGRLTTPPLGDYGLGSKSDITVSFKAAPYYEPNLTTGSLQNAPYITCGATCEISIWSGSGVFENGTTTMTLTNLRPDQTDADAKTAYSWTEHSVKVLGADASTRVSISTIAQKGYYRMWFDDLMIVRGEASAPDDNTGGDGPGYGDGGDGFTPPGSGDAGGDVPGYGDGGDGFGGNGSNQGTSPGYGDGGSGYAASKNKMK